MNLADIPTPRTRSQTFTATPESEDLEESLDVVVSGFSAQLERELTAFRSVAAQLVRDGSHKAGCKFWDKCDCDCGRDAAVKAHKKLVEEVGK